MSAARLQLVTTPVAATDDEHRAALPAGGSVSGRAAARPGEVIDRSIELGFLFNGRPIVGYAGDTIASAIAASGVRTFSRSRRRHVRLGLSTVDRWDPGARLQVDDEPNVAAAVRAATNGVHVRTQHVWPDLDHDLKALAQRADRVLGLGAGDPSTPLGARLRPLYRRLVRRVDIGGRLPGDTVLGAGRRASTVPGGTSSAFERLAAPIAAVEHLHPDIVVIGGGPAGLAAAAAALHAGASVTVVEAEPRLGGSRRWLADASAERQEEVDRLAGVVASGADVRLGHTVIECQPDATIIALADGPGGDRLVVVHPSFVIVATGSVERRLPFDGDHLPGVLLSSGAARLANLWSVRPGRRALVVTDGATPDRDAAIARTLRAVGTDVVDVVTIGSGAGHLRALGDPELSEVVLPDGTRLEIDTLVTSFGATIDPDPPVGLGCDVALEHSGGLLVAATPPNVRVVGALAGLDDPTVVLEHAHATGRRAAEDVARRQPRSRVRPPAPPARVPGSVPVVRRPVRGLIDAAEDRSVEELDGFSVSPAQASWLLLGAASAPGADVRTRAALAALAVASPVSEPLAEAILTCPGPMAGPQLRTLAAAGRPALRRSPMLEEHVRMGARVVRSGDWLEVAHFGDLGAEIAAETRTAVLRDVSASALLEFAGPDAARTLHRLLEPVEMAGEVTGEAGNPFEGAVEGQIVTGVALRGSTDGAPVVADVVLVGPDRFQLTTGAAEADRLRFMLLGVLEIDDRTLRARVTVVADAWFRIAITGPARDEIARRLGATAEAPPEATAEATPGVSPEVPPDGGGTRRPWRLAESGVEGWAWVRRDLAAPLELHVPAGHADVLWRAAHDVVREVGGRATGALASSGSVEALLDPVTTVRPTEVAR